MQNDSQWFNLELFDYGDVKAKHIGNYFEFEFWSFPRVIIQKTIWFSFAVQYSIRYPTLYYKIEFLLDDFAQL